MRGEPGNRTPRRVPKPGGWRAGRGGHHNLRGDLGPVPRRQSIRLPEVLKEDGGVGLGSGRGSPGGRLRARGVTADGEAGAGRGGSPTERHLAGPAQLGVLGPLRLLVGEDLLQGPGHEHALGLALLHGTSPAGAGSPAGWRHERAGERGCGPGVPPGTRRVRPCRPVRKRHRGPTAPPCWSASRDHVTGGAAAAAARSPTP